MYGDIDEYFLAGGGVRRFGLVLKGDPQLDVSPGDCVPDMHAGSEEPTEWTDAVVWSIDGMELVCRLPNACRVGEENYTEFASFFHS